MAVGWRTARLTEMCWAFHNAIVSTLNSAGGVKLSVVWGVAERRLSFSCIRVVAQHCRNVIDRRLKLVCSPNHCKVVSVVWAVQPEYCPGCPARAWSRLSTVQPAAVW